MKVLKDKRWLNGILCALFAVIIMALIVLLKKYNVETIGETEMKIGFAKVNKTVFNSLGTSNLFHIVSTVIMIIMILVAVAFVVLAIIELVKKKDFDKLDNSYKSLALTYVLTAWVYVIFEYILVINNRPTTGVVTTSASFPSTHTLIIVMVSLTSLTMLERIIKNKKILYSCEALLGLLGILGVVTRLLSGKHWFTDIIAGVLFGIMFYFFHKFLTEFLNEYDKKKLNEKAE